VVLVEGPTALLLLVVCGVFLGSKMGFRMGTKQEDNAGGEFNEQSRDLRPGEC
jgi:hypothetical protein